MATPWQVRLRPFYVGIDWLELMFSGPWFTFPTDAPFPWELWNQRRGSRYMVVPQDGTQDFAKRFYVEDAVGTKVLTVLASPRNRKRFPKEFMVVQFANCTLHLNECWELLTALREHGCELRGVKRIDIAADGWDGRHGGGGYMNVVSGAMRGAGRYYGAANIPWGTYHEGPYFNGFHFGTRGSNKFLRCYRKKREMKRKGLKPELVAAWRAALNGADPMKDPREVGRLEISLKGVELRRYCAELERDPDKLAELRDPHKRVEVFASTVGTVFDFRTFADRARDAVPLAVWDWSGVTAGTVEQYERRKRSREYNVHALKVSLHLLYRTAWHTGEQELLRVGDQQANAAGADVLDWWNRNQQVWFKEEAARATGTDKRGGAADSFSVQYMERLARRHAIGQRADASPVNLARFDSSGVGEASVISTTDARGTVTEYDEHGDPVGMDF